MDPIFDTFILFLFCLIPLALAGMIFVYFADPNHRKQSLIRNHARQEYGNARGSMHLKMLIPARNNLKKRSNRIDQMITSKKNEMNAIIKKRDDVLRLALEKYLFERLFYVAGIGESLKFDIAHRVFQGRLTDLNKAQYLVHGIGESRQYSINAWVKRMLDTIEERMKEDFPGKKEIVTQYRELHQTHKDQLAELENEKSKLMQLLARANQEIERLGKIKVRDFEEALKLPGARSKQIDEFLIGSFAEWEVVPQWFQEIVEVGNSDV
jgi:hypothetical protein